jgi:clan AA aspartic protease
VTVCGAASKRVDLSAIVDTDYNGYLTLPASVVKRLKLPWLQTGRAELADGNDFFFDVFEGAIIWDGRRKVVAIDESETLPLIGMKLLNGFELRMQVRRGGNVIAKRLRERTDYGSLTRTLPTSCESGKLARR